MSSAGKATRIRLSEFSSPQMRAFHLSWFAFFLCFFAWFGMAPLMGVVRSELHLSKEQVGWCMIGSVAITIFARLLVGWMCDKFGPRLTYTGLLLVGSLPVMSIGFAQNYTTFLLLRIAIGGIGAAFVVTQYHTSLMFAPNCVGTANATTAGWGNLGGGVTQIVMPLIFACFVSGLGFSAAASWRASLFLAGLACALTAIAYYCLTQDTPQGNFKELRSAGVLPTAKSTRGTFGEACRDSRVWALFVLYAACFGIELTINNVAALYFVDEFEVFQAMDPMRALKLAGLIAGLFGLMNLFARTLGGFFGDRFGEKYGTQGRVRWLFLTIFCEGLALVAFSQMRRLDLAIPLLLVFSLLTQMSEGATFAVVPFINRRALGAVAGIVGAGGNAGAVAAGFLFKSPGLSWSAALCLLGCCVIAASFAAFFIRFPVESEVGDSDSACSLAARGPLLEPTTAGL